MSDNKNWSFSRPSLEIKTSDNDVSNPVPLPKAIQPIQPLATNERAMIANYALDYESNPYATLERLGR